MPTSPTPAPGLSLVDIFYQASGVVPVTITAEGGFFPRDFDPTSTDRRFLGLWVEVKKGTP